MKNNRFRTASLLIVLAVILNLASVPAATPSAKENDPSEKCVLLQIPEVMQEDEDLLKGLVAILSLSVVSILIVSGKIGL